MASNNQLDPLRPFSDKKEEEPKAKSPVQQDLQNMESILVRRERARKQLMEQADKKSPLEQATGAGGLTTAGLALAALLMGEKDAAGALALGGLAGSFQGADQYNKEQEAALDQADEDIIGAMEERNANLMRFAMEMPEAAYLMEGMNDALGFNITGPIGDLITKKEDEKRAMMMINMSDTMANQKDAIDLRTKAYVTLGFPEATARLVASDILVNQDGKEAYERILETGDVSVATIALAEKWRFEKFPENPESTEAYVGAMQFLRGNMTAAEAAANTKKDVINARNLAWSAMAQYRAQGDTEYVAFEKIPFWVQDYVLSRDPEFRDALLKEDPMSPPDIYMPSYEAGLKSIQEEGAWFGTDGNGRRRLAYMGIHPNFVPPELAEALEFTPDMPEVQKEKLLLAWASDVDKGTFENYYARRYANDMVQASKEHYQNQRIKSLDSVYERLDKDTGVPTWFTDFAMKKLIDESPGYDQMDKGELTMRVIDMWAEYAGDEFDKQIVTNADGTVRVADETEEIALGGDVPAGDTEAADETDDLLAQVEEDKKAEVEARLEELKPNILPGMEEATVRAVKEEVESEFKGKEKELRKARERKEKALDKQRQEEAMAPYKEKGAIPNYLNDDVWAEETFYDGMSPKEMDKALLDRVMDHLMLTSNIRPDRRIGTSNTEYIEQVRKEAEKRLEKAKKEAAPGESLEDTARLVLDRATGLKWTANSYRNSARNPRRNK